MTASRIPRMILAVLLLLAGALPARADDPGPTGARGTAEKGFRGRAHERPTAPGGRQGSEQPAWERHRLERLEQLSPKQRERVLKREERLRSLPPERRRQVIENYQRWRSLPEERKQELRERFRSFQKLPREERERLREKSHRQHRRRE